jgi:hypothetical protein
MPHFVIVLFFSAATLIAVHTQVVYICTILHNFLPPWEVFNDYPSIKKPYKVVVYVIGYGAGSARSTVWSELSTADGSKTSLAANGKNGHT